MELTYHWEGDVLIPDLELEDGSNYQIGKYGRMRQRYLFENHHAMYTHLAHPDDEIGIFLEKFVKVFHTSSGSV